VWQEGKRSQDLAAAVGSTKFSAIITSQLLRTRETAEPISAASGVVPQIVSLTPGQATAYEQGVVEALRKLSGQTVLVVSHSRSGPDYYGYWRPTFACRLRERT